MNRFGAATTLVLMLSGTPAIAQQVTPPAPAAPRQATIPQPVEKTLLLNLDVLGIPLDNVEGMTFGPKLPDGRRSLVLVSDNNFSPAAFTQFLLFAVS